MVRHEDVSPWYDVVCDVFGTMYPIVNCFLLYHFDGRVRQSIDELFDPLKRGLRRLATTAGLKKFLKYFRKRKGSQSSRNILLLDPQSPSPQMKRAVNLNPVNANEQTTVKMEPVVLLL